MSTRRKTLISSGLIAASASATAIPLHCHMRDWDEPSYILKTTYHGKRAKKGKAKKDWQH